MIPAGLPKGELVALSGERNQMDRCLSEIETSVVVTLVVASGLVGGATILAGSRFLTAIVVTLSLLIQSLAGLAYWTRCRADLTPLTAAGMAMATGTALMGVSGLLVTLANLPDVLIVLPALTIILVSLVSRVIAVRQPCVQRVTQSGSARNTSSQWWAVTVSGLLIFFSMALGLANYPISWAGSWLRYHPDSAFFEALSESLARLGPTGSIFMPDADLRYHWFSYAWAGQMTALSGAEPFVVLTRVLPITAMIAGALIVVGWTASLTRVVWAPSLAACLLLTGGYLGIAYGGAFNLDSPSQSMGVVWLLALAVTLVELARSGVMARTQTFTLLGFVSLLSFALMSGKVSAAVPGLAAACLLALVGLLQRSVWRWRMLLAAATATITAGVVFALFLSGANGGGGLIVGSLIDRISSQQGINPIDGMRGVLLGTGIVAVAIGARWIGLLWLAADRMQRWQPLTIVGWGLALSSLLALFMFSGYNELWFSSAASAPLAVIGAVAAASAATWLRGDSGCAQYRLVIAAGCLGLLVFTVVWLLWITGPSGGNIFVSTDRWLAPLAGVGLAGILGSLLGLVAQRKWTWMGALAGIVLVVTASVGPARALGFGTGQVGQLTNGIRNEWFTTGQEHLIRGLDTEFISDWTSTRMDAGRWLRRNSESYDLVATNITLDAFVPAVTHLQTYVSGIHYQGPYGPAELEPVLLEREQESWAFIDTPSRDSVKPLCDAGVKWVWIDTERTARRNWEPWASIEFARQDVLIARIKTSACL